MSWEKRFVRALWKTKEQPYPRPAFLFKDFRISAEDSSMIEFHKKGTLGGWRKKQKDIYLIPRIDVQMFPMGVQAGLEYPVGVDFVCCAVRQCQMDLHGRLDSYAEEIGDLKRNVVRLETVVAEKDRLIEQLNSTIEKYVREARGKDRNA